jgi:hypothetical protein
MPTNASSPSGRSIRFTLKATRTTWPDSDITEHSYSLDA